MADTTGSRAPSPEAGVKLGTHAARTAGVTRKTGPSEENSPPAGSAPAPPQLALAAMISAPEPAAPDILTQISLPAPTLSLAPAATAGAVEDNGCAPSSSPGNTGEEVPAQPAAGPALGQPPTVANRAVVAWGTEPKEIDAPKAFSADSRIGPAPSPESWTPPAADDREGPEVAPATETKASSLPYAERVQEVPAVHQQVATVRSEIPTADDLGDAVAKPASEPELPETASVVPPETHSLPPRLPKDQTAPVATGNSAVVVENPVPLAPAAPTETSSAPLTPDPRAGAADASALSAVSTPVHASGPSFGDTYRDLPGASTAAEVFAPELPRRVWRDGAVNSDASRASAPHAERRRDLAGSAPAPSVESKSGPQTLERETPGPSAPADPPQRDPQPVGESQPQPSSQSDALQSLAFQVRLVSEPASNQRLSREESPGTPQPAATSKSVAATVDPGPPNPESVGKPNFEPPRGASGRHGQVPGDASPGHVARAERIPNAEASSPNDFPAQSKPQPPSVPASSQNQVPADRASQPARLAPESVETKPTATPAEPAPRSPAVHDIQLRLDGDTGRVNVRVVERAGEVRVDVRTPDGGLSRALRADLPSLATRIEQAGFHAETWRPTPIAASEREGTVERAAASHGQQLPQQGQQDSRDRQDEQRERQPKSGVAQRASETGGKDFARLFTALR